MSAPIQISWSFRRAFFWLCRQKQKHTSNDLLLFESKLSYSKGIHCGPACFPSKIKRHSVLMDKWFQHKIRSQTRNYSFQGRICWKCGKPSDAENQKFFCECGVVQSVHDLSLFEIIGIDEKFDVDPSILSQKYKDIQKLIHPDKHTLKSDEEKRLAEEQSSLVNKAYSTLLKPLTRALYMLERSGHPLEEDSSSVDQEFLMEIMEINEEIAEVDSPDALKPIEQSNNERLQSNIEQLSKAFDKSDFELARKLVIELKYFTNIDDKIKDIYRGNF